MASVRFLWAALAGVLFAGASEAAAPVRRGGAALCPTGDVRFWRDQLLTVKLASRLQMHPPLRRERIDVKVRGSVVLLSGQVSSRRQQHAAARVAAQLEGIRCVQDFTQVGPPRRVGPH